ncbi:MAG TPA: AgmX/PglI C-terminal domain-containing protein [Labilithrix sp.]|nr:AgmX/PglI C-terminal domain-containing protein [Labilithrix sp.]
MRVWALVVSFGVLSAGAIVGLGCGGATNEMASETPKSASRPPDRTEVTVLPSDAPPTEEFGPGAARATPAAAASSPASAPSAANPSAAASGGPGSTATPEPVDLVKSGGVQADPFVDKAVSPIRPRLRACYNKASALDPSLGGSATFDATIGKEGRVTSARFVKREGLSDDMVGCLLTAVKAMTFDASVSRKTQVVTLSFGGAASASNGADAGATR